MTSNWSNRFTLTFLECYQAEPCVWNPPNVDHRDKSKVADAWTRISELLGKPIKELKSKRESFMGTFRKHFKKKRDSIRSGSDKCNYKKNKCNNHFHLGVEDIYQLIWFAYEFMESFLSPVFITKTSLNSEEPQSMSPEADVDHIFDEADTDNENSLAFASNYESSIKSQSTQKRMGKSRLRAASDLPEQQMATAFKEMTNVLSQRQLLDAASNKEDECDVHGKLPAKKLRELPTDDRRMMMYDIDGLFVRRIKKRSSSPSQNCGYSIPQSGSNRYVIEPKQPKPSNIKVLTDEIIVPARQSIMDEALLNAFKDD